MASPAGCPALSSIQRSLPDKYALQKAKAYKAAEHASPPFWGREEDCSPRQRTQSDNHARSPTHRELLKTLHVQAPQENCSERPGGGLGWPAPRFAPRFHPSTDHSPTNTHCRGPKAYKAAKHASPPFWGRAEESSPRQRTQSTCQNTISREPTTLNPYRRLRLPAQRMTQLRHPRRSRAPFLLAWVTGIRSPAQ